MNEQEIIREFEAIKERNKKVAADKAWETSWTRKLFIGVVTYILAALWLVLIKDSYPFLKAFVPAVGFILSTLSLRLVKEHWIQARNEKNHSK